MAERGATLRPAYGPARDGAHRLGQPDERNGCQHDDPTGHHEAARSGRAQAVGRVGRSIHCLLNRTPVGGALPRGQALLSWSGRFVAAMLGRLR